MKNRVAMMPMGSDFAGHNGELSDEHIKYYELRARGGTGLTVPIAAIGQASAVSIAA